MAIQLISYIKLSANALKKISQLVLKEFSLSWRFLQNDNFWAGIAPGFIFTIVAIKQTNQVSVYEAVLTLIESLTYFWLYTYSFTLANQLVGFEEDRINKPTRPLVMGIVSSEGVLWRLVIITTLFLVYGWLLDVFMWSLIWVLTHLILNTCGHKHWVTKNFIPMGLGAFSMLGAAWEIVQKLTPMGWHWILTISVFIAFTSTIQDFRDINGDQAIGRKTLPIIIGVINARVISSLFFIIWLPAFYWLLIKTLPLDLLSILFIVLIVVLHIVIAIRLLLYRTSVADAKTYLLYLYLYCLYVLSGLVLIK